MAGPKLPEAPQMRTGGFPAAGGRLPVSPQELPFVPGPPQSPEELQQRADGWDQFLTQLTQPGFESTLFNLGTSLLMDKQPGQSSLDHGVSALRNTVAAQNAMKERIRQQGKEEKKEAREEKRVGLEERRVAADEKRSEADTKYREKQLELERKKLDATIKHYDAQARKAAQEGRLSPSDALRIAQESVKVRIDSMKAQLELMDPQDPNYNQFMQNYNALRADAPQLIQQEAQRYSQAFNANGEQPKAYDYATAAQTIRNDPRYAANPTKGETWLSQNYPNEYQAPTQAQPAAMPKPATTAVTAASLLNDPAQVMPQMQTAESTQQILSARKYEEVKNSDMPDAEKATWFEQNLDKLQPSQRKEAQIWLNKYNVGARQGSVTRPSMKNMLE